MSDHHTAFPFEEIRNDEGDYFETYEEVEALLYDDDQIWSVVVTDHDDGHNITYTYGPSHHYVNRLGFIATAERHDRETYYHEIVALQDANGYERFLDRDTTISDEELAAVFGDSIPLDAAKLMFQHWLEPQKARELVNSYLDRLLEEEGHE
jgi:hypothetical protein